METRQKSNLTLVQPNRVTNARYAFTEREENILTLIIDSIQKHISGDAVLQTDLFNQPTITINCDELGPKSKAKYIEAAHSLRKKDFSFEWKNPKNELVETTGCLITTVHNYQETSKLDLTINVWAIPYLLYWGKGVGGTIFNKAIALSLPGEYTKRLYKLCKRWEDRGGFTMSVVEFKEMMCLEDKYPKLADLRKRVLDVSIERMKEHADVYFAYEFHKIGGSRTYNNLAFKIIGNNKKRTNEHKTDMYVIVYNMLCLPFSNHKSSKARDIADKLSQDPDSFDKFYHRLKRLKNELDDGTKSKEDAIKLIRHILNEDYGIQ